MLGALAIVAGFLCMPAGSVASATGTLEALERQQAECEDAECRRQALAALLGRDVSPTVVGGNGWTDLHYAAVLDDPWLVDELIRQGLSPDVPLDTAFFDMALRNTLQVFGIRSIGTGDLYIRHAYGNGETPLHLAAYTGSLAATTRLVAQGADIEARDNGGRTPLHEAVWGDSLPVVEFLVAQGADIEARDNDGWKLLYDGETPLHYAARKGSLPLVEFLVAQGADIEARDDDGNTPLNEALRNYSLSVAEFLVAQGGDIEARDDRGETPLHEAAWRDSLSVAEFLVAQGADIEAGDNYGRTPLSVARDRGHSDLERILRPSSR